MLYNICKNMPLPYLFPKNNKKQKSVPSNRPGPYLYPIRGRGMVLACFYIYYITYIIYYVLFVIYYILFYILYYIYNI